MVNTKKLLMTRKINFFVSFTVRGKTYPEKITTKVVI